LKDNVFAAVSAKYKKDQAENIEHITGLAEKIEGKSDNRVWTSAS